MAIGLKHLFERSDSSGSKSTILKPLTWFISLLLGALILLLKISSPYWIIIYLSIIIGITIFIFLGTFVYCLFTDKDALRSEKYSIQKLAIEKGIIGDDITGIIDESNSRKALGMGNEINKNDEGEA